MMYQIEEAPRAPLHLPSLPLKWKAVFAVLMIGLILLGGLSYVQYQTLNRLSAEYERSKAEVEQLQQLFNLETTILTNEYIVNGSVGQEVFTNRTVYTVSQYVIYNPFKNSTLEMKISFFVIINVPMLLSVATDHLKQIIKVEKIYVENADIFSRAHTLLPSTGWYILHFVPPLGIQGNYTTQYTVSFKIKNQGIQVPFFVNIKDTKTFQFSAVPYILFFPNPIP